ncbi:MAG: methyltransferase, FxLD system [Mycobacterium sp.]|nr:methyltransferase, FxLD system [Mycobacterium sp.]
MPDQLHQLRNQLVDGLRESGHVTSEQVEAAFRTVPRHVFVPCVETELAYRDMPFSIKSDAHGVPISSSSQPAIMARMLEQLDVRPGHRVLEIGTGSGYNAALLAHLVGASGSVVSVDIDDDLVEDARAHLADAEASQVTVGCGDGGLGWTERAPYDRIIATVGVSDIFPAWVAQLAPDGRLVAPLDLRGPQRSIAWQRVGDHLESVSVVRCGFMRLRGAFAGPEPIRRISLEPPVFLGAAEHNAVDDDALSAALGQPGADLASGVRATLDEVSDGLSLWLALHEPAMAWVSSISAAADRALNLGVYYAVRKPVSLGAAAILGAGSLAALVRLDDNQPFELGALPLGPGGHSLAQRFVDHIRDWDTRGRPGTAGLHVTAYPHDNALVGLPDSGSVIDKRHNRLTLTWAS